jgi:hypothetical protein
VGGIHTVAACGDLNGNGRPDVIAGSTDSFVRAYEGNTITAGVAAAESLALADLYHSAGGNGWNDRTGWLDRPVAEWHGVTVVDHRVVALHLDANGLSGTLPSSIGELVYLEVLGLAANELSGAIPGGIGGLESLRGLYLQDNGLSGAVPEGIAGLSSLQHLWIQSNRLVDLPDLGALGGLTDLRVQSNRLTFEDIEPNAGVSRGTFLYSPQDSIGRAADTTMAEDESIVLTVPSGGTHTRYQWTRDGTDIPGAEQPYYMIASAVPGDAGRYVCRLTNTAAPELTLYSRPVDVHVEERTAIGEQTSAGLPAAYGLSQNYPNPFNPRTVLEYDLPRSGEVRLTVYNVLGQKVAELVRSHLPAGYHHAVWDASGLASGVYFARLEAGAYSRTVKMLLLR